MKEEIANDKNNLRTLEEFYVDGTVSDYIPQLKERTASKIREIKEYAEKNQKITRRNKEGEPLEYGVDLKPVVVSNMFFKTVVPLGSKEPMYSAEQLSVAFDYFMELITGVNTYIGNFPPTLTLFCKFIGVRLTTLRSYKNSTDYDLRVITEKIYDQIGDENLTMSQMGVTRERSTLFRLKAENEIVEKVQPNVNISYKATISKEDLEDKLDKYKALLDKKGE